MKRKAIRHTGKHGTRRNQAARGGRAKPTPRPQRWSAQVMKTSDALDLEAGVFTQRSPRAIAASLKRSALASHRRKAEPFRSAMSMLNFHINRSGRALPPERRETLERAKSELRRLFGREA
jgi:hypothetical protein